MANNYKKKWLEISASVIGKSHIKSQTPCQDAHALGKLNNKWRIAVVADGAGSCENAHTGSEFVVKDVISVFRTLTKGEKWLKSSSLPSPSDWRDVAITGLSLVYDNLKSYAKKENINFKSLSSTIIMAIYSECGMLVAHIGDGRAAVLTQENEWEKAITPYKGDEVGATVFITSDYTWQEPWYCIETKVINKKIKGFALLTDGLETYSFYTYLKKPEDDKYYDPNKPFADFFNTNAECIINFNKNGMKQKDINKNFYDYLRMGHPEIAMESDDKTMVIGLLIQ